LSTPSFGNPSTPSDVNRFHDVDDVDIQILSHHHTLGITGTQASPGDHLHDNKTSRKLPYTSLTGTPVIPVASAILPVDETTWGVARAIGVATAYARSDHAHGSQLAPQGFEVAASSALTLGAANADIPGVTLTVIPTKAAAFVMITGTIWFNVSVTVGGGTDLVGELFIAGVAQAGLILGDGAPVKRENASQQWFKVLGIGSKIIKLQGRKSAAVGTASAGTPHTRLSVLLFDL